jgi:hypothetical protein
MIFRGFYLYISAPVSMQARIAVCKRRDRIFRLLVKGLMSFPRKPALAEGGGGNPELSHVDFRDNIIVEIAPVRIILLDKLYLPFAIPLLQLLLAQDCRAHGFMQLEIHQYMNLVFLGKSLRHIGLMLADAFNNIACDTDI